MEENERYNPTRLTPWHQNGKANYHHRLDKILNTVNEWIQPQSCIERVDILKKTPWAENTIDIQIDTGTKEEVAKQPQTEFPTSNLNTDQMYFYTDRSQLKGKAGAGVTAYHRGETVTEETYPLGEEIEVFDAELYTIEKATEIATKYTTEHEEIRKVWIF